MKIFITTLFLFLATFSLRLSAQESIINELDHSLLAKYIQAAKDYYPRRKILAINTSKAKSEIPSISLGYLDMVNASYYWRPGERSTIDPNNPYIVNGVQVGINVSLGTLLQRPFQIKRAKADYKIAQLEQQEYDMGLENEVKGKYYDYIQQLNELKINSQTEIDNKNVANNLKYKFEKGEVTLDVYNQSRIISAGASNAKLQSEVSYLKAKDALEGVIGKKLEEIK